MKKIIPILIVGILVLGGLEAAAVPNNKKTPLSTIIPEVNVKIKKGIGFGVVAIINWTGNLTEEIQIKFTIEASVMILGQASIKMFNPQPEPPGKMVQIRSNFILGLGYAQKIMVSVETATMVLDTAQTTGFVLGAFVFAR